MTETHIKLYSCPDCGYFARATLFAHYVSGSGMASINCAKCGAYIRTIALDDLDGVAREMALDDGLGDEWEVADDEEDGDCNCGFDPGPTYTLLEFFRLPVKDNKRRPFFGEGGTINFGGESIDVESWEIEGNDNG